MFNRNAARRSPRALTLVELLVVIGIIGLLAAILLPVFSRARAQARLSNCRGQLHQFSLAVEMYRGTFNESYPMWLSNLYPVYIASHEMYVCPNDESGGMEGSVPSWFSDPRYNAPQYPETDDTDGCAAAAEIASARNEAIHRCSYIYEFTAAECTWWKDMQEDTPGHVWADFDNNGFVSWREAKKTEQRGMVFDGGKIQFDSALAYDGWVPMVRCFWHAENGKDLNKEIVLNLACEHKNIYESPVFGEGWKQAAGKFQ